MHKLSLKLITAIILLLGSLSLTAVGQTFTPVVDESDATSIKLHWEPLNNIREYKVYRNNNEIGITVSSTGYFTDFRLTPDKTYTYYIDAVGTSGNIFRSDTISATTKTSSYVRKRYKVLALAFYRSSTNTNELSAIRNYFRHRLEFIQLASNGSVIIEPFKNDIVVLRSNPPTIQQPNFNIDYTQLVKKPYIELDGYSIIDLIEKGDIDFVWITKAPDGYYFGENALIGNKNIGTEETGWVSIKAGCSRTFFVNAYLPDERCNDAYAHMVEGIMTSICNGFPNTWPRNNVYSTYSQIRTDFVSRENRNLHLFERFRLTDQWGGPGGEQYSSDGNGNCGTSHFPPNSRRDIDTRYQGDYAYYDRKTWQRYIDCYADDWYNFPLFQNAGRKINGYDFGAFNYYKAGDQSYKLFASPFDHISFINSAASYHQWWFMHIPHNPGVSGGRLNNWWPYIFDFNRFYGNTIKFFVDSFPAVSPVFYPEITSGEVEDSISEHWGYWHSHNGFSPYGKNGIITVTDKNKEPGNVRSGNKSIKVTVENAELYETSDLGSSEIFYPRTRNAGWYFAYLDTVHFSIKLYQNPDRIIDTNPVIKLFKNEGNRIELVPLKNGAYTNLFQSTKLKDADGWYNFSIPISGNSTWEKNIIGYIDPELDSIAKNEALIKLEKEILSDVNYIKICIKSTRITTPVDICSFYIDDLRFHFSKTEDLIPAAAGKIGGDTAVCFSETLASVITATLNVTAAEGATRYFWYLPSGDTVVTEENRIVTNIKKDDIPGIIKVQGHNQYGFGNESTAMIKEDCTVNTVFETNDEIKIYPNPTTGMVYIENCTDRPFSIEVYTIFSRIISIEKQDQDSNSQIDLSGYPSGIYFIKIRMKTGTHTVKVLKTE